MARTKKIDRTETFSQAQRFDTNRNTFAKLGFCDTCAAQAAYGRQLGWNQVAPPCARCIASVDEVSMEAIGAPWRRVFEDSDRWNRPDTCTSALCGATALKDVQAGIAAPLLHGSRDAA
jgi:hypothetical protein